MDISYIDQAPSQPETVSPPVEQKEQKNILEKISFNILLVVIVLSPLVFLTTNYAPIDTAKNLIIAFGVLISAIFYVISSLRAKTWTLPKNAVVISGKLVVIALIISTLLSDSLQKSIIGQGFEVGTASFLCLLFIAALLISKLVIKNKDRLMQVYVAFVISFIILALFQIVRLLVDPSFLSFGVLASSTSTLIGKWQDFGIFAGIIFLLSFFSLRLLQIQKNIKILLYILLILSGVILAIVNSVMIWSMLFIVILAYGIYNFCMPVKSKVSIFALILLVISLLFAFKGTAIVKSFAPAITTPSSELSLPWQLTLDVAADTLKEKPLFGAGPNRFSTQYLIHKPIVVNSSDFWNFEFSNGFAFIPTFFVTGGLIGVGTWLLFFIFFTIAGVKMLKREHSGASVRFLSVSTFLISSFLWLMTLVYNPSHVILLFTFIFTGLFIASIPHEKNIRITSKKIASIVSIIILIILIFWTLGYIKKTVSLSYFKNGISLLNTQQAQSLGQAEAKFKSALKWDNADIYYQALAEIDLMKIQTLGQEIQKQAQATQKAPDENSLKQLNNLLSGALSYSRSAIAADPTNYYNYVSEARVSELALSLKVANAYDNVKNAYQNALNYNPYNPALYLSLAKVETSQNKFDEAQKYIGAALQIKQNYTDAIFLLSQIQVNNGQLKDAINSVQFAIQTNPDNSILYFQLGILQYNDKNYQGAVDALQKALQINNQYANAQYFLGLAYARLGKNADAIIQFENLASTNPDNQEVVTILANLKANKSPFADVVPPSDSKPEKRSTLPVKEKSTSAPKKSN